MSKSQSAARLRNFAVNADRGFWTIVIAHTTLALCFVTVTVQARLIGLV
jgi:putrescine transport system permease protein